MTLGQKVQAVLDAERARRLSELKAALSREDAEARRLRELLRGANATRDEWDEIYSSLRAAQGHRRERETEFWQLQVMTAEE